MIQLVGNESCARCSRVRHWLFTFQSIVFFVALVVALATIGSFSHSLLAQEESLPQELSDEGEEFSAEAITWFETKIRPLLSEKCWSCHRGKEIKGGLSLDSRSAILQGGDSGPAVVPGEPSKSLLIDAIHYRTYEMPPDARLSEDSIALLERWVEMGAPWPKETSVARVERETFEITDEDRQWWAYRPLGSDSTPLVQSVVALSQPIDAFIQQKLEAVGLQPAASIDARRWQRRVWFDLIGLPPEPEDAIRFEQDARPDREAREVDRLLASHAFGVRWSRHWLDVVRFAQTDGYERDGEKPEIWRYRDYVVSAFNRDLPYDRFVTEQIAGDELPDANDDSIVATGFYRLGVWDDEPDDAVMADFDERDDMLSTIGTAFLGTTIGCARCHQHMFDPFSQQDYYQLLAFVHPIQRAQRAENRADSSTLIPLGDSEAIAKWRADHEAKLASLDAQIREQETLIESQPETSSERLDALRKERETVQREPYPFPLALGIREGAAPETHVLLRGNPATPGPSVEPRFPELFNSPAPLFQSVSVRGVTSSGRRTALAQWIVNEAKPLAARVIVNRLWHHLFGTGLAPTTSDLGQAGMSVSQAELVDWLAHDLLTHDWSLKSVIRRMVLSDVYGRDIHPISSDVARIDPDNHWLSYRTIKRLDAEAIRDSVLAVSGNLNSEMGGRGFFPSLDGEVVAGGSRPGLGWSVSTPWQQSRRSLYTFIKRSMRDPLVEAFDYGNTTSSLSERPVTTVAPQALILLNSPWTYQQAEVFACLAEHQTGEDMTERLAWMFQRAVGREPTEHELQVLGSFEQTKRELAHERVNHLVIRPNAPKSLSVDYLKQLPAEMLILPPNGQWSAHRGVWGHGYEGIETIDEHAIPFVQWNAIDQPQGEWVLDWRSEDACDRVSIFASGRMEGERFQGIEIRFEPKEGTVSIWSHQGESTCLHSESWNKPMIESVHVELVINGAESRVLVASNSAQGEVDPIEWTFDGSQASGNVWGLASWGASMVAETMKWRAVSEAEGEAASWIKPQVLAAGETADSRAAHLALVEVARLLFNLNEFVYVD